MIGRALRACAAWLLGGLLLVWRLCMRRQIIDDVRPALRAGGRPYVYALLHAHQIAAVLLNDERTLAAMVSRSADGDLLVPALRLRGVVAVRGSSRGRSGDKGGLAALAALSRWVSRGQPALLAVDGPRGPRNAVHRGVIALARRADAVILPVAAVASRRWVLHRTWDRLQVPLPGCTLRLVFGDPVEPAGQDDAVVRTRVRHALRRLEARYDAKEAGFHAAARLAQTPDEP